jgi:hypothetical protein
MEKRPHVRVSDAPGRNPQGVLLMADGRVANLRNLEAKRLQKQLAHALERVSVAEHEIQAANKSYSFAARNLQRARDEMAAFMEEIGLEVVQ